MSYTDHELNSFGEGIQVIFADNIIHIRGARLRQGLNHQVPAPHLSAVRSLEWALDLRNPELGNIAMHCKDQEVATAHRETVQLILRGMPQALPNLQRLYIGFSSNLTFWLKYPETPKERFIAYNKDILPWADGLAQQLGNSIQEMEVGLPMSVFHAHFSIGAAQGHKFQGPIGTEKFTQGSYYPRVRIWHPVTPGNGHTDLAAVTGTERGYWMSQTETDLGFNGASILGTPYWE